MKGRFIILTTILTLAAITASASETAVKDSLYIFNRHIIQKPVKSDSIDVVRLDKEHESFWRAAAETFGLNMGLWAFDRYIQKGDFAYISWSTIKENFKHGFEWDDDYLGTNMFAHPYNGSLYFNAGRSNGFNFWQSELFAIGGSAMWEMCMEREYPSTNDIIATPIGGAALGEVLYRTADLIIDDRATGNERFGRELAAFLVSPMRGFTRIVTGRAWEHRSTSGRMFGIPPISVEVSAGARMLAMHDNYGFAKFGGAAEIHIEYGDRYTGDSNTPYEYFSFLMELQAMKTQPLLSRVEIMGRLLSREIVDSHHFKASLGMYQHFDYFDSDTVRRDVPRVLTRACVVPYKLGTPASVGIGSMFKYEPNRHWSIDGYAHINGVVLAGILTDYYRDYHRNYNWGSGFSVKTSLTWALEKDKLSFTAANQFYKIYTWQGYDPSYNWSSTPDGAPVDVQGDHSTATFNHLEFQANYRLWHRLYLTFGLDFYSRHTAYKMRMGP